jgi:hypothetical protein
LATAGIPIGVVVWADAKCPNSTTPRSRGNEISKLVFITVSSGKFEKTEIMLRMIGWHRMLYEAGSKKGCGVKGWASSGTREI